MKLGLSMFPTDTSAGPAEIAKVVEGEGFDSFWVSEHSNMPLSTDFPFGDTVPREYSSMLDPFVALTAAACATSRIYLGTAICLLTQRDPINTAKSVASIDHLSGGRVLFGVGAGWNEPEMRNHGTDPSSRFRLMRERVEAMKVLWTNDVAEYRGRFVDIEPTEQWPKPVSQPHPPVLIAGGGEHIFKRILTYGDGWLPAVSPEPLEFMKGRIIAMADFVNQVPELNRLAAEQGKSRPVISVTGMELTESVYATFVELGIDRMVLRVPSVPYDDAMAVIRDHLSKIRAVGATLDGV